MTADTDERDAEGNLTDWALACDALAVHGCDCAHEPGEPGTCLGCVCELALTAERARAEAAVAEVARLRRAFAAVTMDCHRGCRRWNGTACTAASSRECPSSRELWQARALLGGRP